ncbi:thiamine pyrophosphate-dependent dehydrogenase E1 component subunit alpha [Leeia oryzae]|uniref:thiamine pyrophosphate-dependent dehydrogenase E1 component subunit alpha n=1 Tax=Leeia oryzae TaxID=356662 RepID=UPI0012EAF62D|nr:thiamine pyrophosphate-dependent dehydrogenase E1 component subunit alpha [Leeia oryzae]
MKSSAAEAVQLLEKMMLIRAYEEHLASLQASGHFPMTCSPQGQEASAVGVVSALDADDTILTNHRSAGHLLARGADPGRVMAEVMGKATGYCKGKSGSLHISAKELGVVLTSTIVGGELSMVTGVALAKKMLAEAGVVVCFFGDGAACEGIFHESLNLASVWQLPILYVCENNQWQAFVRRKETMAVEYIAPWGNSYAMANQTVNGNDVLAVQAATRHAVAHIKATGTPYLLETWTYRQRGHYSGDNMAHISASEQAPWLVLDPIAQCRQQLTADGTLTPALLADIETRVAAEIARASEFAHASPYPAAAELLTDVYA